VAVPQLGLAGVNGDPDPQLGSDRPVLAAELALDRRGGGDRVRRPGEDGQDRVPLSAHLDEVAAVLSDGGADQFVVNRHGRAHRRRVRLPAAGRALDVGEKEGDRPLRRIASRLTSQDRSPAE